MGCYVFNLNALHKEYTLYANGTTVCKSSPVVDYERDFYAINALVTNILSSGKSLCDAMENCFKISFPDADEYKRWKKFASEKYDSVFSFRFLSKMRDFSQHGHIPVSVGDGKGSFCFDLIQIKNKPHFRHNSAMKQEYQEIIEEINMINHGVPSLSLVYSLAEYVYVLLLIYYQFWLEVNNPLENSATMFESVVKKYPFNEKEGTFIYKSEGSIVHCVMLEDTRKMLHKNKKEAEEAYNEYKKAWDEIYNPECIKWFSSRTRQKVSSQKD